MQLKAILAFLLATSSVTDLLGADPSNEVPKAIMKTGGGYAVVEEAKDLDRITLDFEGQGLKVVMANVLPFSAWPKLTNPENQVSKGALKETQELLNKKRVFFKAVQAIPKGTSVLGYVWIIPYRGWLGKTPAEDMWGGLNLNVYLVERGYTVFAPSPNIDTDPATRKKFLDAQDIAMQGKRGIWQSRQLADKLLARAGRSTTIANQDRLDKIPDKIETRLNAQQSGWKRARVVRDKENEGVDMHWVIDGGYALIVVQLTETGAAAHTRLSRLMRVVPEKESIQGLGDEAFLNRGSRESCQINFRMTNAYVGVSASSEQLCRDFAGYVVEALREE